MTGRDEADRVLEVITVDCYNASEQRTAFYEVFAEEVPLPTTATVVGPTVQVVPTGERSRHPPLSFGAIATSS
jgi:hypothetical protein